MLHYCNHSRKKPGLRAGGSFGNNQVPYSTAHPKHQPIYPKARGRGDQEKWMVAVLEIG